MDLAKLLELLFVYLLSQKLQAQISLFLNEPTKGEAPHEHHAKLARTSFSHRKHVLLLS